jgi:D-hydroxyproline dehydrogenase subunit alpha
MIAMIHSANLVVVGAGPAGLEAALAAAQAGLQVILIDANPDHGGQYFKKQLPSMQASRNNRLQQQRQLLIEKVTALPVISWMNTMVWGIFPNGDDTWLLALHGKDGPATVHAQNIVIATGAYDLPLPFPGWTLPGVITAGAAQNLLKQNTVPGKKVAISGSGPLQLALAAGFVKAGVKPLAVLESAHITSKGLRHLPAAWGQWSRMREGFEYIATMLFAGIPYQRGWSVTAAFGQEELEAVEISLLDRNGIPLPGSKKMLAVDTLVVGYGLLPNNGLARLAGVEGYCAPFGGGFIPQRDDILQSSQKGIFIAGDAAGTGGVAVARLEGKLVGLAIASQLNCIDEHEFLRQQAKLYPMLAVERRFSTLLQTVFHPSEELISLAAEDTIICRCEEITLGEVRQAIAAGAQSPNEIKLLTRTGMGNCQGRICEHFLVSLLRREGQRSSHGGFSLRPPLYPLPAEVLADYAQLG